MVHSTLKRIASGDSTAIGECLDQYGALVWSLARRMSRSPSDAEDATQEIFLDLWRHAGRFDPAKGTEKSFITTIARRRLIDRLRKWKQEPPKESMDALELEPWGGPHLDTAFEISADIENAARAFAQLRKEYQQVIELSLLQGLSHAQIAAKLGMPLGSVKSFLRRGLIEVRELMGNIDG